MVWRFYSSWTFADSIFSFLSSKASSKLVGTRTVPQECWVDIDSMLLTLCFPAVRAAWSLPSSRRCQRPLWHSDSCRGISPPIKLSRKLCHMSFRRGRWDTYCCSLLETSGVEAVEVLLILISLILGWHRSSLLASLLLNPNWFDLIFL